MPENTDYQFQGFQSPRYTPTPDELFDELLAPGRLTEGELRVLLYIIRHTFGWKKESDTISLSQLTDGISRKDGTHLDWGAGVSRPTAVRAVQGLERKGIIVVARKQSAERGNETTTYGLRMATQIAPQLHDVTRVVTPLNQGSFTVQPALVTSCNSQETPLQETGSQEDSNQPPPQKKRTLRRNGADTPASAGPALRDTPAPAAPYSAYIAGVVQDHSTDLGDGPHWRANVTQAQRLWQASGRDEATFVAHLHEARRLVRTYQGKQGSGTIANKMGYYFRCVADLAGTLPAS